MKTNRALALLVIALLGGAALAVVPIVVEQRDQWRFKRSIIVVGASYLDGGAAIGASGALITHSGSGSIAWDFPYVGDQFVLEQACQVSDPTAVTGAALGDSCIVSSNLGQDGGSALQSNATLSCFVSAANFGKVKLCVSGQNDAGTYNLHDAGFYLRTFR